MLRGLTGLAIAVVVAACGGASPSSASPAPATRGSTVVARWVAEDGSIVVLNVVLSAGPNASQPGALARRYQATYPSARVIIRFFDSTAGPERFVIGHVPRSGEPIPGVNAPATQIAIFDLPATDRAGARWRPSMLLTLETPVPSHRGIAPSGTGRRMPTCLPCWDMGSHAEARSSPDGRAEGF